PFSLPHSFGDGRAFGPGLSNTSLRCFCAHSLGPLAGLTARCRCLSLLYSPLSHACPPLISVPLDCFGRLSAGHCCSKYKRASVGNLSNEFCLSATVRAICFSNLLSA